VKLVRVEHNITMNLVHCQPVQGNSRARPLASIMISLRSVVEGWCVIQIPRTERYKLHRYVPLYNAPLRSHFIAHIRLKTPKTPSVHTYTTINCPCLVNQLNQYIYITNGILPLCRVHPPILHGSAESTLADKMHDQVDHARKKPWMKYMF
jgi:hypothetical protein